MLEATGLATKDHVKWQQKMPKHVEKVPNLEVTLREKKFKIDFYKYAHALSKATHVECKFNRITQEEQGLTTKEANNLITHSNSGGPVQKNSSYFDFKPDNGYGPTSYLFGNGGTSGTVPSDAEADDVNNPQIF